MVMRRVGWGEERIELDRVHMVMGGMGVGKEDITVPDMGAGRYLGPESNGVGLGKGGEGGPGPTKK
jgi:hypothetical protein